MKFVDDDDEFHQLLLTSGERDALKDIMEHVNFAHRNGKARMSSAEIVDVQTLTEKVNNL